MTMPSLDFKFSVSSPSLHLTPQPCGSEAPPPLPDEVAALTRARYLEAYETLTGETW